MTESKDSLVGSPSKENGGSAAVSIASASNEGGSAAASNSAAASSSSASGKPKILFIVGSLRAKSFNRQLAEEARRIIGDRAATSMLEWADVPVLNQDEEFPTPAPVQRVRDAVAAADAIWFVTPEYNHSMPGGFKNLIDWLSRPLEDGSPAVIMRKAATYSAFSGGSCGRYVLAAVIPTFEYLQLDLVKVSPTSGGFNRQEYETNVLQITEAMRADLTRQADALLEKIG